MKKISIIISIIISTGFVSCKKENETLQLVNPKQQQLPLVNLIQNPGFEFNGQSSLQFWNYTWGPCCQDSFSTDTATGGGMYSLKLEPLWVPAEGAVETYVTGLTSSNQFCLKFYSKVVNSFISEASASVYVKNISLSTTVYSLSYNNALWTQYTIITAPLQLQPTDTLVVKLSAGSTEVAAWNVLFDNIELYEIPF